MRPRKGHSICKIGTRRKKSESDQRPQTHNLSLALLHTHTNVSTEIHQYAIHDGPNPHLYIKNFTIEKCCSTFSLKLEPVLTVTTDKVEPRGANIEAWFTVGTNGVSSNNDSSSIASLACLFWPAGAAPPSFVVEDTGSEDGATKFGAQAPPFRTVGGNAATPPTESAIVNVPSDATGCQST